MFEPSPARIHEYTVVSNEMIAQNIYKLVIYAPQLASMLKAGQFMSFSVPHDASHLTRIPLSFSHASQQTGEIELEYAVVGRGTQLLANMQAHDTGSVLGPGGNGWNIPCDTDEKVLLISGGIGIAPIVACARELYKRKISYDVIIGVQTQASLIGEDMLCDLGSSQIICTTDDGSYGVKGFVTKPLESMLKTQHYTQCMMCGPEPMMKAAYERMQPYDIAVQVSLERMMTCGFGACNTCIVETRTKGNVKTCTCGPVMKAEEIVW